MIEVFKTNVETPEDAERLIAALLGRLPGSEINFDLDDCDRILRVKAATLFPEEIVNFMTAQDRYCEVLE